MELHARERLHEGQHGVALRLLAHVVVYLRCVPDVKLVPRPQHAATAVMSRHTPNART